MVPFTITIPGNYIFTQNLIYNGPGSAITVASSNVDINLNNFKLTITNLNAIGIDVSDVSSVKIHNGEIEGNIASTADIGINVFNSTCIEIFDVGFNNLFVGISNNMSNNLTMENLCFTRDITPAYVVPLFNTGNFPIITPDPNWELITAPPNHGFVLNAPAFGLNGNNISLR